MRTNYVQQLIYSIAKEAISQASINQMQIVSIVTPIPPYAEQKRIVKKAQQLLSTIDDLQQKLTKKSIIIGLLAQAVVANITGITTEKKEAMKTLKTELVTKLKLLKKPGSKQHAPLSGLLSRHNDALSAKALWSKSGLSIDEFYNQLKTEMVAGWITEPEKATVRIVEE